MARRFADYLKPYVESQEIHGSEFDVTLWAGPDTQQIRFEVFAEMVDLGGKVILDAGCSRGDLAQWLLDAGIAYRQYIGVDALPEVVRFAESRRLDRCTFLTGDMLVDDIDALLDQRPAIVCVSGTLNTMTFREAKRFLQKMWALADEALIFNFLSDRCGPRAPRQTLPARRLSMMKLLDWALGCTSEVAFKQDYFPHGHDATVLMHKTG